MTQSNLARAAEALNLTHGAFNRAGTSFDNATASLDDTTARMQRVSAILDNVPGLQSGVPRDANENGSANASQLPPTSLAHSRVSPSQATIHYTNNDGRSQVARSGDGVSATRQRDNASRMQPTAQTQQGTHNVREEASPNERYEVDEASETYVRPDAVSGASSPLRGSSDTGNPIDAIIAGALPFVARRMMQGDARSTGEYIPRSPNDDVIRAAIEGPAYDSSFTRTNAQPYVHEGVVADAPIQHSQAPSAFLERGPIDGSVVRDQLTTPQQRIGQSQSIDDIINAAIGTQSRTQIGQATDMPTESRNVIELPDESKLSTQHGVAVPRKGNQTQAVRTPDVIALGADKQNNEGDLVDNSSTSKRAVATQTSLQSFKDMLANAKTTEDIDRIRNEYVMKQPPHVRNSQLWGPLTTRQAEIANAEFEARKASPSTEDRIANDVVAKSQPKSATVDIPNYGKSLQQGKEDMQDVAAKLLAERRAAKPASTEERIADNAIKQTAATDEAAKPKRTRSAGDNLARFNRLVDDVKNAVGDVEVRRTVGNRRDGAGKIVVETSKGEKLGEYANAQELRAAMQELKSKYASMRSGVQSAASAIRGLRK